MAKKPETANVDVELQAYKTARNGGFNFGMALRPTLAEKSHTAA